MKGLSDAQHGARRLASGSVRPPAGSDPAPQRRGAGAVTEKGRPHRRAERGRDADTAHADDRRRAARARPALGRRRTGWLGRRVFGAAVPLLARSERPRDAGTAGTAAWGDFGRRKRKREKKNERRASKEAAQAAVPGVPPSRLRRARVPNGLPQARLRDGASARKRPVAVPRAGPRQHERGPCRGALGDRRRCRRTPRGRPAGARGESDAAHARDTTTAGEGACRRCRRARTPKGSQARPPSYRCRSPDPSARRIGSHDDDDDEHAHGRPPRRCTRRSRRSHVLSITASSRLAALRSLLPVALSARVGPFKQAVRQLDELQRLPLRHEE